MKATEIQIGDWVKLMNPHGEWIDNVKIDMKLFSIFLRDGEEGFIRFEPIPLTAEILEKKGWIFMEGQEYSTFPVPNKWVYQFVPFALKVNGDTYSIANTFTIKYVHELQHALRLCGLNDIAEFNDKSNG